MEKIDLSDKYIHSPNWENRSDLERFRNILKSGYLLTPLESGIKTRYYYDRIFFAVHPNGIFSRDYPESGLACFSNTDGYLMASQGIFFILNAHLREDYDLQPVKYKYECATRCSVDLIKYLEGIGNAGFNISEELIYTYYFIKYVNGEVPASKVIDIVRERNLRTDTAITIKSIGNSINSLSTKERNYLYRVLSSSVESLLEIGKYYEIVKILEEEGRNAELYDRYGYVISPQSRFEEVKKMYAYIEKNKDIQMGDFYFKKIGDLCEVAGKQIRRTPKNNIRTTNY